MLKRIYMVVLSAFVLTAFIPKVFAQGAPYPAESYTLSEDGKTLVKWDGVETVIDMQADAKLKQVETIGEAAFQKNETMTGITLPSGLKSIEASAFYQTKQLSEVTLPDGVVTIGDRAFNGSGLKIIMLSAGVKHVGVAAFAYCGSLTEFKVASSNTEFSSVDGVLFSKDKKTLLAYPNGKGATYVIPNGTTTIGDAAFGGCEDLTGVTVSADVTTFERFVFSTCVKLTDVTFSPGSKLKTIGESVFYSCPALETVDFPAGVTSIGDAAFYDCGSLTKVTLPEALTFLDQMFFIRCENLRSITLPAGIRKIGKSAFFQCSQLGSVVLPAALDSIDDLVFSQCYSLKEITLPKNLVHIGRSVFDRCASLTGFKVEEGNTAFEAIDGVLFTRENRTLVSYLQTRPGAYTVPDGTVAIADLAFAFCMDLTDLVLPEGLKTIGTTAFGYCKGLKTVALPSTLDSIANFAFSNTISLSSVACKAVVPPKCDEVAIREGEAKHATLYVPDNSIAAYKADPIWKLFGRIESIKYVDVQQVSDLEDAGVKSYGIVGGIVVESVARTEVSIFEMGGRLITACSVSGEDVIPAGAGIYMVKTPGHTSKVIVK